MPRPSHRCPACGNPIRYKRNSLTKDRRTVRIYHPCQHCGKTIREIDPGSDPIKTITIRFPWTVLFLSREHDSPLKTWELRNWSTDHRGTLLLHAAKSSPQIAPESVYGAVSTDPLRMATDAELLPVQPGCVFAIVDLVDVVEMTDEMWNERDKHRVADRSILGDRPVYAWKFDNIRPTIQIEAPGYQRLWNYWAAVEVLE